MTEESRERDRNATKEGKESRLTKATPLGW